MGRPDLLNGLIFSPAELMSDYVSLAIGLINIIIIIYYLGFLMLYGSWLHKSKKSVLQGGPCVSMLKYGKAFRGFSTVIFASLILLLITILLNGDYMTMIAVILAMAVLSILLFAQKKMRQKGVGRNINRAITIILAFVFVSFGTLIWGSVVNDNEDGQISEARKAKIPVKTEELFNVNTSKAEYEYDMHSTFILKHFSVGEYIEDSKNEEANEGNIYKWCLWGLKRQGDELERDADVDLGGKFEEIENINGVEKIYRFKADDYECEWLICYKDKKLRLKTF